MNPRPGGQQPCGKVIEKISPNNVRGQQEWIPRGLIKNFDGERLLLKGSES